MKSTETTWTKEIIYKSETGELVCVCVCVFLYVPQSEDFTSNGRFKDETLFQSQTEIKKLF